MPPHFPLRSTHLLETHPSSSCGTSFLFAPPIARMHDCGGLMIAEKLSTLPYIPRLETVKVPPWNSCGWSLPSRARAANSLISALIVARP